jgi:hypothetical protein
VVNTLLTAMTPQLACWLPAFNPLVTMLTIAAMRVFSTWPLPWRQQQQQQAATTNQIHVAPANQPHNNGGRWMLRHSEQPSAKLAVKAKILPPAAAAAERKMSSPPFILISLPFLG